MQLAVGACPPSDYLLLPWCIMAVQSTLVFHILVPVKEEEEELGVGRDGLSLRVVKDKLFKRVLSHPAGFEFFG